MEAIVELINTRRGMVAAKTEDGEFIIFELLGSYEPQKGDAISHSDFHTMGREIYRNMTQKSDMDVFVQNIVGTLKSARAQCFLEP
jgi:hypothetical protein